MPEHNENKEQSSAIQQPQQKPPKVIRQRVEKTSVEAFSGPIPPPEILKQYNDIVPNAAERIISMAEKQSDHRQYLEKTVINSDIKRSSDGLRAGLIVALVALVVAGFLGYTGHEVAAATIGSIDLVGLISIFVLGTINRRSEREQKAALMKYPENDNS